MDRHPTLSLAELVARPRQEQNSVVVGNSAPQDGFEHVVDRPLASFSDRSNVQPGDQAALAEVHVLVISKVVFDGNVEPRVGWDQQQAMEVKAAIAKDERGRRRIPLVDLKVGSPDKDRKLVGRSGPRLAVGPRHERRVDPLDFILHRLEDCAARTGKLNERERHQMGGPPVVYSVDDHLGEAVHELTGDGINSADSIVLVYSRMRFDPLIRFIELVLLEFVPVGFGWIGMFDLDVDDQLPRK